MGFSVPELTTGHRHRKRRILDAKPASLLTFVVALNLIGCSGHEPREVETSRTGHRFANRAPVSVSDGVCAESLRHYGITVAPLEPSVAATGTLRHTRDQAVSIARSSLRRLPKNAVFGSYSASVSDRSSGHDQRLGRGPLQGKTMWVVEIGNIDYSSNGHIYGPGESIAPPVVYHHVLDFVDDATGIEAFDLTCP